MNEQPQCLLCILWWELGIQICFLPRLGIKRHPPEACLFPNKPERNAFPSEAKPCLVVLSCSQWLQMLSESRHFSSFSYILDNVFHIRACSEQSLSLYVQCLVSEVYFLKTVKLSQEEFLTYFFFK